MTNEELRTVRYALQQVRWDLRARVRALWWIPPLNVLLGLFSLVLGAYLAAQAVRVPGTAVPLLYVLGTALNAWSAYMSLRTAQRELGMWLGLWMVIRELRRHLDAPGR